MIEGRFRVVVMTIRAITVSVNWGSFSRGFRFLVGWCKAGLELI